MWKLNILQDKEDRNDMTYTCYAGNVRYSNEFVIDKPPWKQWDDLANLKSNQYPAYCIKRGSVATRSGTYNTPAPIVLDEFNINISAGTRIKRVILHYSQQKFSLSGSQADTTFPVFGGAKFTLLGTGQSKTGEAINKRYTNYTLEFTGVTLEQLQSKDFGIKVEYPRNNSTNTGRMCLGNVYLEIETDTPTILLGIGTENNNVVVDDNIIVDCSVEKVGTGDYNPIVDIVLPTGLSLYNSEGHGTLTQQEESNEYRWNSEFGNRTINIMQLAIHCDNTGTHEIILQDTLTNISKSLKINVKEYEIKVSTTLSEQNKPVVSGSSYTYGVDITTDYPTTENRAIKIKLPSSTTIQNRSLLEQSFGLTSITSTETNTILNFTIPLNHNISIPISAVFPSGFSTQDVLVDDKLVLSTPFISQPSSYESLGFARLEIPEIYTETMGHNILYTFSTIARYEIDTSSGNLRDWKNNLRVGIYNYHENDVDDEDDFLEHVIWCNTITDKKWTEYQCDFVYDSKNPVYLVYSHDYVGNPLYDDIHFDFSQAVLVEKAFYGLYPDNYPYPVPVGALLNNTEYAIVTLEKRTNTAPVIVYDFRGIEAFQTEDISVRGIYYRMEYNVSEDVEIQVTLGTDGDNTISGYRNRTLRKGSGTLELGGRFDLFGLTPHMLRGKVSDLRFEVSVNNPYDRRVNVELRNVTLEVNYLIIEPSLYGFEIDGERSEEYGLYFYDTVPHLGTKNEIDEYSVTGSDKSIVNRMNINPKELELELAIDECDLEEELAIADDVITKLFTNKRNILTNKPIEKYIIFDHMPDKRYWFVRKDEIDDKLDAGTYYMKIKLYVSQGTAEIIPKVSTGSSNATNSTLSIEPVIHLISSTKGIVNLTERNTNQSLLVNDNRIGIGDTIIIDNETRTILLRNAGSSTDIDITSSADFSTTWFRLRGEYNFTSPTSIISEVEYYERR